MQSITHQLHMVLDCILNTFFMFLLHCDFKIQNFGRHFLSMLQRSEAIFNFPVCRSGKSLFTIEWLNDGAAAIKASNGKYLTARMNGSLYAVSDEVLEKERFVITIINRPRLVLKCDYGFIGLKTPTSTRYECNRAAYDTIILRPASDQSAAYNLSSRFFSANIIAKDKY